MPEPRRSLVTVSLLLSDQEMALLTEPGGIMVAGGHGTIASAVRQALYIYGRHLDIHMPLECFRRHEDPRPRRPRRSTA